VILWPSFGDTRALHHLNRADKQAVIDQAIELLKPGGWFVNVDLVVSDSREIEGRIQHIRVHGIVERARSKDERFRNPLSARRFLDELEANEGEDQPLTLVADLEILRTAGLQGAAALWLEHPEVVCGGELSCRTPNIAPGPTQGRPAVY
jgi:hypothetical protein